MRGREFAFAFHSHQRTVVHHQQVNFKTFTMTRALHTWMDFVNLNALRLKQPHHGWGNHMFYKLTQAVSNVTESLGQVFDSAARSFIKRSVS